jgi:chemotaxis protein CheD
MNPTQEVKMRKMLSHKTFPEARNNNVSSLSVVEQSQVPVVTALEEVRVDMAELKVETKPLELVTCVGSCVAVCLYDSSVKIGGMAHVMLPHNNSSKIEPPAKFADTAVPALIKEMKKLSKNCIPAAKIAGGANMFPNIRNNSLAIGTKNIEAVKAVLYLNKISLRGEDVGGTQGRRISLNPLTGRVNVRLLNGEVKKI